jgi:hypothetical protein
MGSVNGSVELHGPPPLAQRRGPAAPPPDVRRVGVAAFPGRDTCLPSTINSPQAYAQAVRFCCFDERANLRHPVRGTSATAPGPGNALPRHPGHGPAGVETLQVEVLCDRITGPTGRGWQGLWSHRRSSSRGRAFSIAWRSVSGACAPDTAVRRLKIKQGTPSMSACRASRSAPSTSSRPSSEAM